MLAGVFGLLTLGLGQAAADDEIGARYAEPEWTEAATVLPPFPKAENLVEFYTGPLATNHFSVDASTLSVGEDGVVRYVLVVTTSGGVRNISFEGIHCAERKFKVYAIGRDDGTWLQSNYSAWKLIENKSVNRQHAALNRDYFCPYGAPVASAEEARMALRDRNR